jgi:lipid-A-disaccharide synthase
MKNILILAAENSAENYGTQIVNQFRKNQKDIHFFGVGGNKLAESGVEILIDNREFSVIGIIEVLSSIMKFKRYMNHLIRKAVEKKAAAALLIDFPDFNLRMAKKLKKSGIDVYYYISPTVWAWRYSRVKSIKKYVHHLFIIFPFEIDLYKRENIPFTYTGHPLLPLIKINQTKGQFKKQHDIKDDEVVISLLPGSRPSEVKFMLPEMIKAIGMLKESIPIRTFLLKAYTVDTQSINESIIQSGETIQIVDQTQGHDLINCSDLVITTCGTSNLEIAMIGVPFVVCYRVHPLSYLLGIHFVKIKQYSIVNILAQEIAVPELIQKNFKSDKIVKESLNILKNKEVRKKMLEKFSEIKKLLQQEHNPSEIIFNKMLNDLFP